MSKIDAIQLEVMRNKFEAIAEEMGASLVRTSYSTNIKDRRDCSCALFSAEGDVIAQAAHIPVHLGVLPWGVKGVLSEINKEELNAGDTIMHNNPYVGGTHLPDIILLSPVFFKESLVGFVGNLAHHSDVGGMVPGSLPPMATEIFQEGLIIPPVKLRRKGKLEKDILNFFSNNVRTPYISQGDLMAQLAANNVGERRFKEMCEEFGEKLVIEAVNELEEYSDRRMKAEIKNIPSGIYSFEDYIEGDGHDTDKIALKVKITVNKNRLLFDFTGTSKQTRGPINAVFPVTMSAIYYVVKTVTDSSIPPNSGTFRRIDIIAPEGTVVNASFPAPINAANNVTSQRLVDLLTGALAKALPNRVSAAATGSMNSIQIAGYNQKSKSYFVHPETYGGGYGATYESDGTSGIQCHMTNTRNAPVEVLESTLPVKVEKYGLVADSEGPGLYRGGFGITRCFQITTDGVECSVFTDRQNIRPWGLQGGKEAKGTHVYVERNGKIKKVNSKEYLHLNKGDRLILETSGGGGWGSPYDRSLKQIQKDIDDELVSIKRAIEEYGVKITKDGRIIR